MGLYSIFFQYGLWSVSLQWDYGVYLYNGIMECIPTMGLWSVSLQCDYGVYPYNGIMECILTMGIISCIFPIWINHHYKDILYNPIGAMYNITPLDGCII